MSDYRVVEIAPVDGRRSTRQKSRIELYAGPDVQRVRRVLEEYWKPENQARKPFSETRIYLGGRRIYAYEL